MHCIIEWMDLHQGTAAWVQAVFSVLAIAGAYWIGKSQSRAALQSVEHAHRLVLAEKRKAILSIIEAAGVRTKAISDAFDLTSESEMLLQLYKIYDKTIIDAMVRALSSVPMYDVGSTAGILALQSLHDQVVFLGKSVEAFIAEGMSARARPVLIGNAKDRCACIQQHSAELAQALRTAVE